MARQRLYVTMTDDASKNTVTSSSRRGNVDNVSINVLTDVKGADDFYIDVTLRNRAYIQYEYPAEERISYFKEKGNYKKVAEWKQKLKQIQHQNRIAHGNESIDVDLINLKHNNKVKVNHSGVELSTKDIKIISLLQQKKFSEALEAINKRYCGNSDIVGEIIKQKL